MCPLRTSALSDLCSAGDSDSSKHEMFGSDFRTRSTFIGSDFPRIVPTPPEKVSTKIVLPIAASIRPGERRCRLVTYFPATHSRLPLPRRLRALPGSNQVTISASEAACQSSRLQCSDEHQQQRRRHRQLGTTCERGAMPHGFV